MIALFFERESQMIAGTDFQCVEGSFKIEIAFGDFAASLCFLLHTFVIIKIFYFNRKKISCIMGVMRR